MKCDECLHEKPVVHVGYGICLCENCRRYLNICGVCGRRGHQPERCPQLARVLKGQDQRAITSTSAGERRRRRFARVRLRVLNRRGWTSCD